MELATAIDRDGRRSALFEGGVNAGREQIKGLLPANALEGLVQSGPVGGKEKALLIEGLPHRGALDAHLAQAGRMLPVPPGAPGSGRLPVLVIGDRRQHLQPATDAAVGADRTDRLTWGGGIDSHRRDRARQLWSQPKTGCRAWDRPKDLPSLAD